jgi:DNA repair protein RecN (Recombination protein N)
LALSEECYGLLYEDDAAALAQLRQVFKRLGDLAAIDPRFRPHLEARETIVPPLEDLALALRDYREKVHAAPGRLDAIESRLALIDRLKRKYGATLAEVLAFGARCRADLEVLGSPEERASALEQELATAEEGYLRPARSLAALRREAAEELAQRVEGELRHLAMEKARFRVAFEPATARPDDRTTWTARGLERAEFLLSPNPGEELRPLAKIASGGELSRVLLALECVSSRGGRSRTLVFDEVDVGIGGRVADVVGRKLRELAERHQVLCVTHLPQIAAQADRHHAVRKRVERGRTVTEVVTLDEEARVEEIARMLAGEIVTDAARDNARQLLKHSIRV